ncbi:MAG TPA: bifunctional diguanylate cyclase/phosphodiesterase [Pseudorhodoplanes sp.]|nr:bifunctional diguanylate cyclase/phosphodiesterase [Pseudorhodoplanes sp.]
MTNSGQSAEKDQDGPASSVPPSRETAPNLPYGEIMRMAGEAAYEWHIESDTLTWAPHAAAVLGIRNPSLIASGRSYAALLDPGNARTRFDAVLRSQAHDEGYGVSYQVEYCLRSAQRSPRTWIEDTGRWFAGSDGKPVRACGVIRCINTRRAREQKLAYLSRFDALTGESNRWHLAELMQSALDESVFAQSSCGFLLVAVDNLRSISDAFGYEITDAVIREVAKRLRSKMRTNDELGRFSGNKFGIILKNCTPEDLAVAAERFLSAVRGEILVTPVGPVVAMVTIGGVTAPRHAGSVTEILSRALEALDRAQQKRPGSFAVYRPNRERDAIRRENIRATDQIVGALNDRRIVLAYEPVIEAESRKPAFYECLMRIQLPDGGIVPAQSVIPIAERLGLVSLIDHRVLELVIEQLSLSPQLIASVNISPASTADSDWWARLVSLLRAHGGAAERLIVEITEMSAIHNLDDTRGFVARVKDLGCRVAIDDFGAGYTSFRNLRKLGVDIMKIDGEFVRDLSRSEDDRAFVRTMVELGQRLGLKVVAEWVQDECSAQMLARWGCHYLQGELSGRAALHHPWSGAVPAQARLA